ncbi:hypothetical protein FQN50_008708 [Emmonsiellopsis sp. PD_5]|nr:hypothetical protein FQN50_008708 [Emmonsiellopsis sp. PD_5]
MYPPYIVAVFAAFLSTATAQDPSCGIIGYDTGANPAFLVNEDAALATLEACGNLCSTTETCQSFAFGADSCLLYNVPVADNVTPIDTSPYNFNDLACASGTPTDPTTTGTAPADPTATEAPPARRAVKLNA